jgi:hypothetical protein
MLLRRLAPLALVLVALAAPAVAQPTPNKCTAGKKACIAKKTQQLLACLAAADKKGLAVDAGCIAKAKARFDGGAKPEKGCFAKLEAKQNPDKPATICPTTNDTAAVEAAIDGFVDAIACQVTGGSCLPASGSGEDCANAELVSVPTNVEDATSGFAFDYDACGLAGAFDGPDRVYAIAVPPGATVRVFVNPVAGSDGASVALFAGLAACGSTDANQCAAVDIPSGTDAVQVEATNEAVGSVIYYALVGSPGTNPVTYDVSITFE